MRKQEVRGWCNSRMVGAPAFETFSVSKRLPFRKYLIRCLTSLAATHCCFGGLWVLRVGIDTRCRLVVGTDWWPPLPPCSSFRTC